MSTVLVPSPTATVGPPLLADLDTHQCTQMAPVAPRQMHSWPRPYSEKPAPKKTSRETGTLMLRPTVTQTTNILHPTHNPAPTCLAPNANGTSVTEPRQDA